MGRQRTLAIVLRCMGCIDMLALVAVLLPGSWMSVMAVWLGLEPLPTHPIVGYLARSASVMYALHGVTVFYISFDVVRYWQLIRFLALAAMVHGTIMVGIDLAHDLPLWWRVIEGPLFSATGVLVFAVQGRRP